MAEVVISINRPVELFQLPISTPLDPDYVHASGMQQLHDQLKISKLSRIKHIRIRIIKEALSEDHKNNVRQAVNQYVQNKISDTIRFKNELHKDGVVYLSKGILVIAVCLFVTYYIDKLALIPEFLDYFLSEWLIIVGWVSLWRPVDIILFDEMPLNRDLKIYRFILKSPLIIDDAG